MRTVRTIAALAGLCALVSLHAVAQPSGPLGTAQLQISGARLTLYSDSLTTDADQTLNVGEPGRVRTCYGAGAACGSASAGSVPGLKVVGELTGPELPQAVPYETVPNGTFFLPGFQREGDYLLENIRLVETATGRVLANAEPSLATLHVRQILLATATVTRLTLADLQARGIALTQQNFQAFSFSVGFLFSGELVNIELPVIFQSGGKIVPLDKQTVLLDQLPDSVKHLVQRWEPPQIVPFKLEGPPGDTPDNPLDEGEADVIPLYGAIVIPGNVSFLNQFFDARLIVANGAPNGSGATLQNVTGALKLPGGDTLRIATTAPPVSVGQKLPLTKANGSGVVGPGEQATASWTVEGLVAGTQTLRMEIAADLVRPGRATVPLSGSVQAAVEVVDARFNLAFNHPDVVREGEAYSLYVTVTNLSRAAQNLVTVELLSENITGAHQADPADPFRQTITTLDPGGSETLEFRLVSDTTGKCVATTFQSSSPGLQGTIHLRTGVGELGIPLSPASLVLPRFSELLPRPLITANVRLLGLAYSLAVAPAGAAPAGLPHVLKSDVVRRAVDLAEAGQRLYLQERLLESLEVLALDQTGNRHDLADYDTLRRALEKGAAAASALSDVFRQEQQNRNLAAGDFVDHFAATTDYGRPYLAAALVPNGTQPAPVLEVRQVGASGTGFLAYTSDDPARLRTVPYGEVYALADVPGGTVKAPFALVGRLDPAASYRVDLHAPATGASGRLILVVPTDDLAGFVKVDLGVVSMGANEVWEVRAVKAAGDAPLSFGLYFLTSGIPVPGIPAPAMTSLQLPPFRLIGAVEDFTLDRYGLGVSYLFNRPPDKAAAETASNYAIRSSFHGQDTASPPVTFDKVATKAGAAAFWQPNSERVVNVRYQSPISALVGLVDGIPIIRHEHLLATNAIRDTHGTPLDPSVPVVLIEPDHTGGLVDGRVLLGTGEPAVGATVQLLRSRNAQTEPGQDPVIVVELVAEATTGSDGAFYFDFIEEPPSDIKLQGGFTLRAAVPPGSDPTQQPGGTEQIATTIRLLNRLVHVNIALLGRGTVKGTLVYADDGTPVPNGHVAAASSLFSEAKDVIVAADGSFTISALPVGPITLTGRDTSGNRVYQTVALAQAGQTVSVALRISRTTPPKTGTVTGRVLRQRSGSPLPPPEPSPGAQVAVYSNSSFIQQKLADASGNFRFEKVPEGQIQVQAADFSVSRTSAIGGAVLPADGTVSITLTLSDAPPRVVTGRVLFHDDPSNTDLPVAGAVAFIIGPGVFAYTDASGTYRIEGVPVQGAFDPAYAVTAIDFTRQLQGMVNLPPILDVGDGSPIRASDIVLRTMTGGIDGVVLDPLGRPIGGISVQIRFGPSTSTGSDGHFSFDDIGVGSSELVAHAGNGLLSGRIGYFGTGSATIVFGGHRPFVTIRLRGSGVVNIHTRTASSTGVLSPIRYTPTVYRSNTFDIGPAKDPVDTTTDQDGRLQLILPLPGTNVTAFSGFNGNKSAAASLTYPGQVVNLEIVFDSLSTVTGHVVGVDGVTPVPDADVFLTAAGLLPQKQRADGQGSFRYELVPAGGVSVTTEALVGSVDRVGRADGRLYAGQTIDLTVVLRAQGTVKGRVFELVGNTLVPIPFARYTITESAFPNRRLPTGTATYAADANGAYEVSHLFAGPITVVATDPAQVSRQGRATAEITSDFQVLQMPDIVLATSIGSLGVLVRDPQTGSPVPDCQITLSNGDVTVSDAQGQASFDALPLGTYSVYAFHAPTGQGGVVAGLRLAVAGDHVDVTIFLDTRGQISGTLWDDPPKTRGVGNGTIQLAGRVNGRLWGTSMTALGSTSSDPAALGQFLFDGIPVGTFTLVAAVSDSARRASTALDLTPTAPVASVDLVLEQLDDRYARVFQNFKAAPHLFEVDPSSGIFEVELTQPPGSCAPTCTYDFLLSVPTTPYPNHLFKFPGVYASRSLGVVVRELSGEQRKGSISGLASLPGAGSASDPYRVVLGAKGTVNVLVKDGAGNPVSGANVTLTSSSSFAPFGSTTDGTGRVTFDATPAGSITVSAKLNSTGFGGLATGVLTYDDESLDLTVNLAPAVSAHGVVYHPLPGDLYTGDPSTRVPEDKAIVQIRDSSSQLQIVQTGSDGTYRFSVLRTGAYTISASNQTNESVAFGAGTLVGPDGTDNALPDLILDASRPLIVSLTPPPGQAGVSRGALVEIVFSEPLLPAVLPTGSATSPYFALRSGATGLLAGGSWTSLLNALGQQVVRFTPSSPYDNSTVYSLTIVGGPGGVRDRAGRPLTDSGDVGSNFTTSDTVGASVVGSVPPLAAPVDPVGAIRFDFSEVVSGTASELDGDGVGDAAELFWQQSASPTWQPVPITMFLTRGGYSLTVQQPAGVTYPNDSLKRRIHLSRLRDVSGNPMVDYDRTFRIWDTNAPHVDASLPPGAPGGDLFGGTSYTVTPVLSNLDDLSNGPGGDLDRVDYFLASAGDPSTPSAAPVYSARVGPFAFSFVAAYIGNGVDPRPFPVWVQAVDTSTNKSNTVKLAMQVLPNVPPVIGSVAASALAPAAGTFYAGSSVRATALGVSDPDGSQVTLAVELRKDHPASPNDPADLVATPASRLVARPATGWGELVPPAFDTSIPIAMAEATSLFFRVKATDSLGLTTVLESPRFTVAHDPNPPTIDSFVARATGASSPSTQFTIGQKFAIEFRARDAETAARTVTLDLSAVFTSPAPATLVGGTTNLYRTSELTVPTGLPPAGVTITATASATDWGGNTGTGTLTFLVSPSPDPYAPTPEWISPWDGSLWPAAYTSILSPQGAALLLRASAADKDQGPTGDVPGTIVSAEFRGPADAAGTLAAAFMPGVLVPGTGAPGAGTYQLTWRVPNGVADGTLLPFEIRVIDTGGNVTTQSTRIRATSYRKVYEGVQTAVLPADTMLAAGGAAAGPVFLLDGTTLSVYPQTDSTVRTLTSVFIWAGGQDGALVVNPSVLTAPEVTSYASSVLFNPLELTVTDTFGLGAACRVDMSEKGLLGSTPTQSMVLPGQIGSQIHAGGSHGGSGGPGSPGGWTRTDLTTPGSVYDLVKDPALPGGGGGYGTGGTGTTPTAGGTGGGVVRLLAPGATVHLGGDVFAGGGEGPGGFSGGGGAGGAIRIVAGRLEGAGLLSAAGGRGTNGNTTGGGGGGRIALSFFDPAAAALALILAAPGGLNNPPPDANAQQRAGAGTIYVEETDALGAPKAPGRLIVTNGSGKPAWPTPFTGAQRFGSVEAHGAARLVFDDDLAVGQVDPGALNDRASLALDPEARAELRSDTPQIALTAVPDGGDVAVNQALTLTWTASDPIGLFSLTKAFSPQAPLTTAYDAEPLSVTQGAQPLVLTVPGAQPPGPISYTLTATDRAGRVTAVQKTWNVVADTTAPVVGVTGLAAGGNYHAGQTLTATVTATDNGAIATLNVLLDGQTFPLSGAGPNYAFSYAVPANLAAPRDTTFQAVATDASGNSAQTAPVPIHLLLDAPPSLSVTNTTGGTGVTQVLAGATLAASATAADDVAVATVVFTLTGAAATTDTRTVNLPSTTKLFSYKLPTNLTAGQTVTLQVDANDSYGHKTSAAPITFTILADTVAPAITPVVLSPVKPGDIYTTGDIVTFTVSATDNVAVATIRLTIDGVTTPYGASPAVLAWTAPNVSGSTPYALDIEALDVVGNRSTASTTISVIPAGGGTFPVVSFTCPTTGSYLPSAYTGLLLTAAATDSGGVTKIEFFRPGDTTPFSTATATGAPTSYTGTSAAVTTPTVASDTIVRYQARAWNPSNHFTDVFVDVHVVPTVDIASAGAADFAVLRTGTLVIDTPKTYAGLIVLRGASVTHTAYTGSASTNSVNLTVNGPMYLECGASIDVSGRGYPANVTYPGATQSTGNNGGSHIGTGGTSGGTAGSTYGSVYRPQEAGTLNPGNAGGGGVVRIVAGGVVTDGAIRANGVISGGATSGSGGSVWMSVGTLSGSGTVEARGGEPAYQPTGGGGAIAVEYTNASGSVLSNLLASAGRTSTFTGRFGAAGSVYVKGPASTYGDLTIDNKGVAIQQATVLPSLGAGTAQAGSAGTTLVTDRAADIAPYFAGHWVEIYDATGTTLKGTWRISTQAGGIVSKTVTLVPNGLEMIAIAVGDKWQGVYRFDSLKAPNGEAITSADPIRLGQSGVFTLTGPTAAGKYLEFPYGFTGTDVTVTGNVSVPSIVATNLTVKAGAILTHPATTGTTANSLTLNVSGTLTVEAGASIDVSGRGYPANVTYPGATQSTGNNGGSHIGTGGTSGGTAGSTYGSVYRPQEAGTLNPGNAGGGGVVRIVAGGVVTDGAIRANGVISGGATSGSGGSVWMSVGTLSGSGTVEARGGEPAYQPTGGGGAIAVEYTNASGSVLSNLLASAGRTSTFTGRFGAAGSVYVKGPASTYGDLTIDNKGVAIQQATVLPSLGAGTAQAGSAGTTLVTDRAADIAPYFAGHWVEIYDATGTTLKGTWRISTQAGGIVSKTVTLVPNGLEMIAIAVGDKWQGVYRFDSLKAPNGEAITSADPIRLGQSGVFTLTGPTAAGKYLEFPYGFTGTDVTVTGNVSVPSIVATNLTVKAGAILTHPATTGTTANSLTLNVSGTLTVEAGASIDVSGRGYPANVTYPGATQSTGNNGGSHIGTGGTSGGTAGSTYGSVYRPQEAGTLNPGNAGGGGVVRIVAGGVVTDGAIRANGVISGGATSGSGGSVWMSVGTLSGSGTVEARGGEPAYQPTGGGGAIAVEYTNASGSVLSNLLASAGRTSTFTGRFGAAGSVYVKGPASTYGDLTIDNKGVAIQQATVLPSLGAGTAQAGSAGTTLVTDRAADIAPYFAGHWVEIYDATGTTLKGTWRISTQAGGIVSKTVTLVPNGAETISVAVGDLWRGIYRFDNVSVLGNAALQSIDPIVAPGFDRPTGTLQFASGQASSVLAGSTVNLTLSASDPTGLSSVTLRAAGPVTSGSISQTKPTGNVTAYATTFQVTLLQTAAAGDTVTLAADIYNKVGTLTTTSSLVVTVIADNLAPTINGVAFTPPGGTTYPGGTNLTIDVDASDNVGVKNVTMTVLGVDTVLSATPYRFAWTAPAVAAATPIDLIFKATDNAGNFLTVTKPLTITQADSGTLPVVSWTCPSGDQTVPAGYTIQLGARATDDSGVIRIEFYRGSETTPIAVVDAPNYLTTPFAATTSVLLPGAPGPISFRARAYDVGLRYTEATVNLNMIATVPINPASPDWATLATNVGVLSSGTLVIDQKRTLGGLMVLSGATVTQPATVAGTEMANLQVTGQVWVECGGSIDVSGRGYAPNRSYPGATLPGDATGGSHLGYGGLFSNPLGTTYGSVTRPQEAGGGSGNGSSSGGGIVRIVAGSVVVDGAIRGNGATAGDRTGAGGSVWISAASVGGAGAIEARGGDNPFYGTGGGGAIAVEYTSSSGTVLNNLVARTGSPSGSSRYGGAGTVYLKGPTAVYGDLVVDNLGVAIVQATELPSLGSGVAQAGSAGATLVTDRAVDIPAYFAGNWVEITDGATSVLKGTCQISTAAGGIVAKTVALVSCSPALTVNVNDKWQGVYRFDNVMLKGTRLLSTDPVRASAAQIQSTVEVKRIDSGSLTVKAGATLTHLVPAVGSAESLVINLSGALTVEAGGAIDVTGRGYAQNRSYPGAVTPGDATGGSHLGYGGLFQNPLGSTYGSVTRPQEAGGGSGNGSSSGGGIVRIVAGSVVVDGAIRGNGATAGDRTGAGGSVWISAASVGGAGAIEARGGDNPFYGTGGGGAIAVEYTSSSGTVLNNLVARTGSPSGSNRYGGAGTVYLKGPSAVFGTMTVDNGGKTGQATALPSLGNGTAQAGTAGATLVTDRAADVPAYFAGHYVEISDASNVLKGTCRISTAPGGIVAKTVTLASCSPVLAVNVGDKWQGVYRFDQLSAVNGANLASVDPVRTSSSIVLDGSVVDTLSVTGPVEVRNAVSARRIDAQSVTVKAGGTLTQFGTSTTAETLTVNVSGALTVEAGGSIDVSGRGYAPNRSYPGATLPGDATGGSHLGYGGLFSNPLGTTYGSVTRPQEAGGGSGNGSSSGGGIVRIVAGSVVVDGAIRGNGATAGDRTGAGGSVWISAASVGGAGAIEARGGDNPFYGTGGGGAIAVEYTSSSGTVLNNLVARTGSPSGSSRYGGAGTVYLKGPTAVYGDLVVDNLGVAIVQATELPSLGSGVAQAGSAGATLVTDRAVDIPAYFAGNWVEITDGATSVLKGTCQISTAAGGIVAKTVALVSCSPALTVNVNDKWQGVYRFDNVMLKGTRLLSTDPVRASAAQIQSTVEVKRIDSGSLTVKAGATLTHLVPAVGSAESLVINLSGALTVEAGGAIDVTGRGYAQNRSYPGAVTPGDATGGSHLGYGGLFQNPLGSTYGSVTRPQEAGGGSGNGSSSGGGIVRIVAGSVVVDGAIRGNGATAGDRTGAGGSVWISAASVGGAGAIEARGGDNPFYGTGGGGAIAVEYTSSSGTVLNNLVARTGSPSGSNRYGGAGTVYLKGPSAVFGTMTVDNGGKTGQATALPSLGNGTAQAGTAGATLVTDRAADVPAYFAGHYVEISDASNVLKGTCRISTAPGGIVAKTVTLASCSPVLAVNVGDKWQGVYRFDVAPTVTGSATLANVDPIRVGGALLRADPQRMALPVTELGAPRVRSVSVCSDAEGALKPGSSFTVCADVAGGAGALDVSLEISGGFDASMSAYGNCHDPIAIPGSAKPGPLRIVATVRDGEGRVVSASAHLVLAADEQAPVLVSAEPAGAASFRSGDPLRIAVETWDDVGIASVAISVGGQKTVLTAPPFEIRALAPPVASKESLPVLIEVFDPSGNVSSRRLDVRVLPSGTPLPAAAAAGAQKPEVSLEDGLLSVDGGWPWRDADGETRGRTLELPAIGAHTALAVDGADEAVVTLDGSVARGAVHGGAVDVHRGGEFVGRFRILSVSEDGTVLRLEAGSEGKVQRADFLEGNWAFESIDLTRGAQLVSSDAVYAHTVHVDASSLFLSKNLQIPSDAPAPPACPAHGPRPDPPGMAPSPEGGTP